MTQEWLAGPRNLRNPEPGDETLYRDALALAGSVGDLAIVFRTTTEVVNKWLTGLTTPSSGSMAKLRAYVWANRNYKS